MQLKELQSFRLFSFALVVIVRICPGIEPLPYNKTLTDIYIADIIQVEACARVCLETECSRNSFSPLRSPYPYVRIVFESNGTRVALSACAGNGVLVEK